MTINKTSKYIFEDDRVVLVSAPKAPAGGYFTVEGGGSLPISQDKQIANLGWVKDNAHMKNATIDMGNSYRVSNALDPVADKDYVTNSVCKSR